MADEKRLIDANSIPYCKNTECHSHGLFFTVQTVTKEEIDQMPTVDAVEVVHGQWLKVKDGFDIDRGWKCSSCNNYVYAMTYEPYEYCPHCGARMDGGRKKNG